MKILTFEELCDLVINADTETPNRYFGMKFRKEPYKSALKQIFPMIETDTKETVRAYVALLANRQLVPPICAADGCNNYVKYHGTCFDKYCSRKCSSKSTMNDPEIKEKIRQTNLERYGYENPLRNPKIREKMKETMLERYGSETPFGNSEIQEKAKQTNLERYGSISPFGNSNVQEKIKQTNLERHGVISTLSLPEVQEKIKQTNLERYGCEYSFGNSKIREKVKKTFLEKYGHESPLSNPEVQEKIKQTNLERYGYENVLSNKYIQEKRNQTNMERYGCESPNQTHFKNIHILQDPILLEKYINEYRISGVAQICNCNTTTICNYAHKYCITLPTFSNSYWETELAEYIDSLNINYSFNDRNIISPYELDFYLPDHNIAIELNGSYWHSEINKGKTYHHDKFKLCQEQGIQLWQIWDTDWNETKDIWKSKIQCLMPKATKLIDIKKCSIQYIPNEDAEIFYNQNHLQGYTAATQHLGLVFEDTSLAMMSFNELKVAKNDEFEMTQFCTKLGYQIPDVSVLLSHFQAQNPKATIIAISDNMYPNDFVYEELCFISEKYMKPEYSYTKGINRYYKEEFTKDLIQEKFGLSDEDISTKTEFQLMDELGFHRIWDAGKTKWILKP